MVDRVLFMTDKMKFIYGDRTKTNFEYENIILLPGNPSNRGTLSTYDFPITKNWNHLMISHEKQVDGSYWFYASYGHENLYNKATWATPGIGDKMLDPVTFTEQTKQTLRRIIFCCNDWTVNFETCQNLVWMDAYYRHLKIWDLQYMSRFSGLYACSSFC
jgi:hypothetical protein